MVQNLCWNFRKNQRNMIRILWRKCNGLIKDGELRISEKKIQDEKLLHKLFLTIRQKAKIRIAFANNISTDLKHSKAQLSKITQSGGFLGNIIGNLDKKALWMFGVLLAKVILPQLATKATLSVIGNLKEK